MASLPGVTLAKDPLSRTALAARIGRCATAITSGRGDPKTIAALVKDLESACGAKPQGSTVYAEGEHSAGKLDKFFADGGGTDAEFFDHIRRQARESYERQAGPTIPGSPTVEERLGMAP